MRKRHFLVVFGLLASLLMIAPLAAQEDVSCAAFVLEALDTVGATCENTARNQACYGNRLVDVDLNPGAESVFAAPGDLALVADISRLHTAPLNLASGEWGIALLKIQADLPDTLPGQNVTFLLTGDVTLTDTSAATGSAPMQSFYFTAGIGEGTCRSAPSDLVIQSPQGTRVSLNVNGVDLSLGSTAVLEITAAGAMDVLLVGGAGEVTALDTRESVPAGQSTTIGLDENGLAITAPSAPVAYDPARIQHIPLQLLPETIQVSSLDRWTATGIELRAGQTFTISASGMTNPHADEGPDVWSSTWHSPLGMIDPGDCTPEWKDYTNCQCLELNGVCPIKNETLMVLIAHIGDGPPFVVGASGTFTADRDGMLYLAINDDRLDDNAGTITAIVTVFDDSGQTLTVEPAAGCAISATATVNLRRGPGTTYEMAGQLTAGMTMPVIGQATGDDGFVWWWLADDAWVRSGIVSASEACDNVPVVSPP